MARLFAFLEAMGRILSCLFLWRLTLVLSLWALPLQSQHGCISDSSSHHHLTLTSWERFSDLKDT